MLRKLEKLQSEVVLEEARRPVTLLNSSPTTIIKKTARKRKQILIM